MCKELFETNIRPPGHDEFPANDFQRYFAQQVGRSRLIYEVETILMSLRDDLLHAVTYQGGSQRFIFADVVQRYIAETAPAPVASMRQCQFIPPAITPQPVHRIGDLYHRDIV